MVSRLRPASASSPTIHAPRSSATNTTLPVFQLESAAALFHGCFASNGRRNDLPGRAVVGSVQVKGGVSVRVSAIC